MYFFPHFIQFHVTVNKKDQSYFSHPSEKQVVLIGPLASNEHQLAFSLNSTQSDGAHAYLPSRLLLSLRVCSSILTSALTSSLTAGGSARGEACRRGSGVPPPLLPLPRRPSRHIMCHVAACKRRHHDKGRITQHVHVSSVTHRRLARS